jgi:hypothetical protein
MENIEIELKAAKAPGRAAKLDTGEKKGAGTEQDPVPVEQEPGHRLVFANQYVRVLEVIVAPGETTPFPYAFAGLRVDPAERYLI